MYKSLLSYLFIKFLFVFQEMLFGSNKHYIPTIHQSGSLYKALG